jgi:holo-[acyl-carrier protein] synthase
LVKGIGNDLVEIARIDRSLSRHGERFAQKILSDKELALFQKSRRAANFLAKRFAAKEAVSKALGTGIAQGVTWHDIEIWHQEGGQPCINLYGAAHQRLSDIGAKDVHISITDEAGLVSAFSIIS